MTIQEGSALGGILPGPGQARALRAVDLASAAEAGGRFTREEMYDAARDILSRGYQLTLLYGTDAEGTCDCPLGPRCHSAGKHPQTRGWAVRPIRTVDELAARWASAQGTPNLGIIPDDGLLVIDVDRKNGKRGGETLATLEVEHGTLGEPSQHTASGGLHFVFRVPPGTDPATLPNRSGVWEGIDVLRTRRQFVAAPSQIGTRRYQGSLPPRSELPMLPIEWLTALQNQGGDGHSQRVTDPAALEAKLAELTAPSPEKVREVVAWIPNRSDTGRDAYVWMAHAIKGACGRNGESEGLQVFMQWASKWEGPVDQAEDERVFASIGWQNVRSGWPELWRLAENYGYDASAEHGAEAQAVFATVPIPAGTPAIVTPVATASLDLHDKLIELRERLAVISDPLLREATRDARLARLSQTFHVPFGVLQKLLDAFDAPHRQVPVQIIRPGPALRDALSQAPPLALVPGYLFADMQHVLYGTPQSLKTFTALDFALHIASGKPWLGSIPVAQRGVVFFAGEAASSLRVRIAAWCAARSVSVEEAAALPFALIDAVPTLGHGDDGLRHAIDRVQEAATEFSVPVGLLVLDNMTRLAAVAGLSTTDTGEYGRILAGIDALGRATKASTLTIYHSPVSDPSRPAGTYQSTANPDVIMKAEREANAPRTLIRVVKTRNASPPPDLPLEFKVQDVRDWLAASYRQEGLPFPETLNTAAEVFGADNQSPNNAGDLATAARESLLQQFTSLVVDSRGAAQASSLAGPNEDNQLEERVLAVLERHPEASQKTLRAALRGTRDTNIDGAVFNLIQDGFVEDRRKGSAHAYQLTTTGSARVVAARKPDYAALAEFEQNAAGAPQGDD